MFRGATVILSNEVLSDTNFDVKINYNSTRLPSLFPVESKRIGSYALSTLGCSYSERFSSNTDIRHIKSSHSGKLSRSITSPPNVPLNFLDIQKPHGNF